MIWLFLTTIAMPVNGQILGMNRSCPAYLDLLHFRKVYIQVNREHEKISNKTAEQKIKIAEEKQELKAKYKKKTEKLWKHNTAIRKIINTEQANVCDCLWYLKKHSMTENGVYDITVGDKDFLAQCDMNTDGGGWTVIFSRDFTTPFGGNRSWQEYKDGFGDAYSSYWIGNDNIYKLAEGRRSEVYFQFVTENDIDWWVKYQKVTISSETEMYRMHFDSESYNGTIDVDRCDNTCRYINIQGTSFSTKDVDNDQWTEGSCADVYNAGWWYGECLAEEGSGYQDDNDELTSVVMMIRAMQ